MAKNHTILMADIIKSSAYEQDALMRGFKRVVSEANRSIGDSFLSPMTITLGDEFQSVPATLSAAIDAIFKIEEEIIDQRLAFKLRYVLTEGRIDTPINTDVAYAMLGSGLTSARELLSLAKKRPGNRRFHIALAEAETNQALSDAFLVLQVIIDHWRPGRDYELVSEFLKDSDYKIVAARTGKTRSLIHKRRKSLMIEQYFAMKSVIHYVGGKL
jgi:hypothetical protein